MNEQQQASGEVPECALGLLREAAVKLRDCREEIVSKDYGSNTLARIDAFLAAHEPAPGDPLRVMVREFFDQMPDGSNDELIPWAYEFLRARVTVAKGVE